MEKALTAILTALFFCIMALSIGNAQKGEAVDPAGKGQSMITADSDQYVIGPEDVLLINVWKEDAFTRTLPVRIDGKISLPLLDDIQAAGLTPLQLKEALAKKLKDFVEDPAVTVTVMEANSFKAYVSGEVKTPGVYKLHKELTLVKLIIMAGGFTEWANQKNILIITKEKGAEKRITANYKKIIEGEEPDIVIKRGDTVIVR
jgi:polysaccharide export outer membrane protein